ncbi:hypothetical protein [Paenibacillus silvae]|uniref:hypothetical protein n=1 Tax=Paenibacillus silvae TaxID=1325358 RepID=UPI00119ED3EF|nr:MULTISPECIES: hypothetical protein [Paenibacillus]MCK6078152.1 hypothetical protein [Paenibacillus silvae]MCK6152494.1 hypothetical protein [Paenibacillus silvae]MCK6271111.1 hypothetical protein [Paenibacillus silvae]
MRITKGTASKTIAQLGSKGLISKFQREDKVHFRLTEIGQLAFETITVITSPRSSDIDRKLDSYSPDEQKLILQFIERYTEE